MSVDPRSDLHPDFTPYAYVYDDPILLVDPNGLDSLQRAEALAEIQKYLKSNPSHSNKKLYVYGDKGGPGKPSDCSGMVGHGVAAAGVRDPGTYGTGRGVQRTVKNTRKIAEDKGIPGDIMFWHFNGSPGPNHEGMIVGVEYVNGKIEYNVAENGESTGPVVTGFFDPETNGTWRGKRFVGIGAWDSPDPLWSETPPADNFQTESADVTSAGN